MEKPTTPPKVPVFVVSEDGRLIDVYLREDNESAGSRQTIDQARASEIQPHPQ
jgi:hypothetical protein